MLQFMLLGIQHNPILFSTTLAGGFMGYLYAWKKRTQQWQGYAPLIGLNYGYIFYGGLLGYVIGKQIQ